MTAPALRLVDADLAANPRPLDEYRDRLFLTVAEIARLTDTDPRTVRRWLDDGGLPVVRISDNTIRVPAAPFWQLAGLDPQTLRGPSRDEHQPGPGNSEAGPARTGLDDDSNLTTGADHAHSDLPSPAVSSTADRSP